MMPRIMVARVASITLAASLVFFLLVLFSPAPLAFALESPTSGVAAQVPSTEPSSVSDLPPLGEEAPVPPAEADPVIKPDPAAPPTPPAEVVDPVDPALPTDPIDPAPGTGEEVEPIDPAPNPAAAPEPTTPAVPEAPVKPAKPPAPAALPPIPPAPSDQPTDAAWSPGNPDVHEFSGSGDQGVPTVGVDGLIGDNYPMHYKNMPIDPVVWDEWNFAHRQCTSFVSWRLNQVNDVPFDNQFGGLVRWGNAGQWGDSARSLGIRVDTTPAAGAIAYSAPGTNGSGSAGHVAWVAKVLDDGRAVIEEYNAGAIPGMYGSRIVPADAFTGYIHLKDLPPEIKTTADPPALASAPVTLAAHVSLTRDIPLGPVRSIKAAMCVWVGNLNGDLFSPRCSLRNSEISDTIQIAWPLARRWGLAESSNRAGGDRVTRNRTRDRASVRGAAGFGRARFSPAGPPVSAPQRPAE